MTFIRQENFGGIAPKVDPRRLSDELAQEAENCLFEENTLRSLREPATTGANLNVGTDTIFRYQGAWLQFSEPTHAVLSPVVNDVHQRVYITDSTYPKVRSGAGVYRLGVPAPGTPTVSGPVVIEDPDTLVEVETVYYVVTVVDGFGAEGPPCLPTIGKLRNRNEPLSVTFTTKPSGDYNLGAGAKLRIYRSNSGTESTVFQFAGEVPFFSQGFTDNVLNEELQEVLPSTTWSGPPDDNSSLWPDGPLQGMEYGPNGILSGFSKRTVYFSEPYLPHAWPTEYSITIRDEIKATKWISAGLLVVTNGIPVLITGAHPASMTVFEPEKGYACSSARSLVDMGGWAIYQSPDGLIAVEGLKFILLTEEFYTNNLWRGQVPTNSIGGNSEGRYVLFWDNGAGERQGLVFDPLAGKNAITTTSLYSGLAYHDMPTGNLLVRDPDSNTVAVFDAGGKLPYVWRSKIYTLPTPTNFAFLELVANNYPVQVVLKAGDRWGQINTVFSGNVAERIVPLPSGFESLSWSIEVSGTQEIVYAGLYEDLSEIG